MNKLPKPIFVHCALGGRACFVVLSYKAKYEGSPSNHEEFISQASSLGYNFSEPWKIVVKEKVFSIKK